MKEEIKINMKIKIASSWKDLGIEDEIGLISQIYGGFDNPTNTIQIILDNSQQTKSLIGSKEDVYSIKRYETLDKFVKYGALTIINECIKEFDKTGARYRQFDVLINWPKLHEITGYFHDFEAKEPYPPVQQEKIMRKMIFEKALKARSYKLSLSEKDLGRFIVEPIDDEQLSFDKSPDLHIKFMTCLFALEKQKIIKITGLDFDFDATRIFIENISSDRDDDDFIYYDWYSPAGHCHVEIEIDPAELKELSINKEPVEENKEEIKKHKNWLLKKDIKEAFLIHNGKTKFTFKHNDSIEYRCFEYLFKHIDKKISYEEIYKNAFLLKYPAKGNRTNVNRSILTTAIRIEKQLHKIGLKSIRIIRNMGLLLIIKER